MNSNTDVIPILTHPLQPHRRLMRLLLGSLAGLGLIALGAVGALRLYAAGALPLERVSAGVALPSALPPESSSPQVASLPSTAVEVVLTPEAMRHMAIKTAPVTMVETSLITQLPGSITADAYREVQVMPVVGGIVTKVPVVLGATVKRGAPLAVLLSPELAEVQTKYLSMQAMLAADTRQVQRLQHLAEIGAVSRRALDEITAVHASHTTEVEAARQRLRLLGLSQAQIQALQSPSQIISEVLVPAPIDGVITGRAANPGQVVSVGQELFVVTDLSQVWGIGDLYERDFERLGVGSQVTLSTLAYPGRTWKGRVAYIDPRVDPQTRTAKVRVEVPNRDGRLRLGMYATMTFTARGGASRLVIPRSAVQSLGERQVVFVPTPDEAGTFVQRPVRLGPLEGDVYAVLEGLQHGEQVVTEGSFLLRAESLRLSPAR